MHARHQPARTCAHHRVQPQQCRPASNDRIPASPHETHGDLDVPCVWRVGSTPPPPGTTPRLLHERLSTARLPAPLSQPTAALDVCTPRSTSDPGDHARSRPCHPRISRRLERTTRFHRPRHHCMRSVRTDVDRHAVAFQPPAVCLDRRSRQLATMSKVRGAERRGAEPDGRRHRGCVTRRCQR